MHFRLFSAHTVMRIIPLILFLMLSFVSESVSQIKQRSQSKVIYTGAGYKFVLFTDGDAQEAYPFFDFTSQAFVKEVDAFIGVVIGESVALEFSPSYMFSNDYGGGESDEVGGFSFSSNGTSRFYVPTSSHLYAIPINIRAKYFPFSRDYSSAFNMFYIGGGGGPVFISEEMEQRVYSDDSRLDYLGATRNEDSFWTYNIEAIAGIATVPKFGIGFELCYRLIPLSSASGNKPLITSIADNFNNVDFALNIIYKF